MIPAVLRVMFYCMIAQLLSLLLDCFFKRGHTDSRKNLEIRLLANS